jgi:MerR family transcriptional regulator, light-induced transcriptional regulator
MTDQLSPRQVARAIGVSEASLKRWCDKGLLPSVRTPGGHRRLTLSAVVHFLRETGHSLPHPELLSLPSAVAQGRVVVSRTRREMIEALAAGEEERFRGLALNLYLGGLTLGELCDEAIAPAFAALGERWQHGALEVYEERRGCEIALALLHELRHVLPAPRAEAPLALGGTLADDPYTLPNAMVELGLRELGWRTINCGCGLPPLQLATAVRRLQPRLCWLSVSTLPQGASLADSIAPIAEAVRETGVRLIVGGRGAPPPAVSGALPEAHHLVRLGDLPSPAFLTPAETTGEPAP